MILVIDWKDLSRGNINKKEQKKRIEKNWLEKICFMLTVGIDLGTTATVIAVMGSDGEPRVVPSDSGKTSTPSVVYYGDAGSYVDAIDADADRSLSSENSDVRVAASQNAGGDSGVTIAAVGREALSKADGYRTVFSVKRSMGTSRKFFQKTPEEVSADILSHVKHNAEQKLGDIIGSAVITVPAHFSDIQRIATKRAASLAGIKVLRLINEPTAAALAFGLGGEQANGLYAVYDFGGGTFDFSVLRIKDGIFQVLATGGDNYLGGDDIDRALLKHNLEVCGINEADLSEADELLAQLVVKNMKEQCDEFSFASENEKLSKEEELSKKIEENVEKKCVISGSEHTFVVSGELLRELSAPYLKKTFVVADQALSDAKVSPRELDGILMVGGMTKLRLVTEAVKEHFGSPILNGLDPEKVVAFGAAIQADAIANKSRNTLLIDVVPLTLGIETFGGGVDKIIHRNTPIPVTEMREYTTYADNQNAIKFHVVQGERALAKDCRSIATFELKGIPAASRGVPKISVKFFVDVNGLLSVSACEQNTGLEQSIVVEPSAGLTEDDMISMLESAMANAKKDREQSAYINAKMSAERQAAFWESIVEDIPEEKARKDVKEKLRNLRELLTENTEKSEKSKNGGGIQKIRESTESIEAIVDEFLDEIISERLSRRPVKII